MNDDSMQPLHEILHNANARYLTVKPAGIVFPNSDHQHPEIAATVRGHGGARTLYRGRRPHCRSLNGVHAMDDREKRCRTCHLRKHCTPHVRLDLLIGGTAYRMLLSYTSATRFLEFEGTRSEQGKQTDGIDIVIRVVDRGRWGELRFECPSSN